MKKRYLAVLLALSLTFTSQAFTVMSFADEEHTEDSEDKSDKEDKEDKEDKSDKEDKEDKSEDKSEDNSSDSSDSGSSSEGASSEGGSSESDTSESDTSESETGMDEQQDDSVSDSVEDFVNDDGDDVGAPEPAEGDMLRGIFPTTPVDEEDGDIIRGIFPTTPVEEEARTVKEESEEKAVGISSVPDPDQLNLRPDDVVSMVMPVMTNEMYNFTIDPYNLLSRYSDDSGNYDGSSLYFKNSGEKELYSGISDAAMAKNKSSLPVIMYVSIDVENKDGWDVKYADPSSVNEGEDKAINFSIVPVGTRGEDQVYYTDRKISIDEKGHADVMLLLNGTADNFEITEEGVKAKEDASWDSLGFAVAGSLNPGADWSDINARSEAGEKISLCVSCRMKPLDEEQRAAFDAGDCLYDSETGIIEF